MRDADVRFPLIIRPSLRSRMRIEPEVKTKCRRLLGVDTHRAQVGSNRHQDRTEQEGRPENA